MNNPKKSATLYFFPLPFWLMFTTWFYFGLKYLAVEIIYAFIINSIVLMVTSFKLKLSGKKSFYFKNIFKIVFFGLISQTVVSLPIIFVLFGNYSENKYLPLHILVSVLGFAFAAFLIYFFNYYITFKSLDSSLRKKLAVIFAVFTAPYNLFYGFLMVEMLGSIP